VALCDDLLAELEEALKRPAPSPPAP
jgi:hypothetical protein